MPGDRRAASYRAILATAVAVLAFAPLAPADTVPLSSTPLSGSTFQGGDGNQDDQAGFVDWQGLQAAGHVLHSPDPNAQDSALAGGAKLLDPGNWELTTEAGGVDPGKVNILDAWSAVDQPAADTFLYLGFTREDGTGTAAITFELNRDARLWNNGHAKIPCRTDGDLLISTLPHGNAIDIVLFQWTTKTADPATGCAKTGTVKPVERIQDGAAQGAVNSGPITSRLPGAFAPGSQIPTSDFSEVALNLSTLMADAFGDQCFAYTSVWMHSRSSISDSSNVQDYVAPQPLSVRTCAASGTKFLDRNANGVRDAGEPGLPRFLIWADYDNDGVRDANEPFSVTDDHGDYVIDDIRPSGSYRLREMLATPGRRRGEPTSWTCSFPNAGTIGGFANGTGGLFGCGWGPISVATTPNPDGLDFGNWVPASLTVEKQLWPADDPGRFDLIVNGVTVIAGAGDGKYVTMELPPGTYNISEVAAAGTNLADYDSAVECRTVTRRRSVRRGGTEWNGLVLKAGDHAMCTFVNVRKGIVVPAIALEKSGPTLAEAGDTLRYTLYVTNPGTVPLPAGAVKVADNTCDDPPELSSKGGDGSPDTLDPGDTWTYRCSHKTAEPAADCETTAVTNTATASATAGGVDVSDDGRITTTVNCPDVPEPPLPPDPGPNPEPPPSPLPEPLPGPLPSPVLPFVPPGPTPPNAGEGGIAGISASNVRCITRASQIRLTGQRMGRITVSDNGRRVGTRTLQLLQRRVIPLTRVFSPGHHRLTIRVTFEPGSGTAPVTLTRTVTVCGRSSRAAPRVTG
jgi:hypothetical protein